jgi:SAM-dependent methyltransferase
MGSKYQRYQDYVIRDGSLVGEFEEMYRDFDDPWEQSTREAFSSEKTVCVNLIAATNRRRVIEIGCGFGQLTNKIRSTGAEVLGIDISATAVAKATRRHPSCSFAVADISDRDLFRRFRPDCIVMAEVTWYVLDKLDEFLAFLKREMPDTLLIHLLMTYREGVQQYGRDKFTKQSEIMDYFGMHYLEWGSVSNPSMDGGQRTYFAGSYSKINQ